jgi:hypothetical protein
MADCGPEGTLLNAIPARLTVPIEGRSRTKQPVIVQSLDYRDSRGGTRVICRRRDAKKGVVHMYYIGLPRPEESPYALE